MNVTDEILLEDSDDDFVPSKLIRRRSSTRRRSSVERLVVGQKQNSTEKSRHRPKAAGHVEDEIVNNKGISKTSKEEAGKDLFKNALKEKLTAATRSNGNSYTPPLKKKLSESWKDAQAKLTPMTKSNRKFFTIDNDYDFKDEPSKQGSPRIQPKNMSGSSAKVAKLNRSFTKSTLNESIRSNRSEESNTSLISLDDDEDDLEVELAKIDKLKQSLDRQSEKPNNKTPFLKKTSNTPTSQPPVKIKFSNSIKKSSSFASNLQRATPTQANKQKTMKKDKVANVPKEIKTGPIDIFDDLIIKTTHGHPCNFCDKNLMFKKRREMINHLQLEHEEELTRPQRERELAGVFTCATCDSSFHSKHILRVHSKAHKKVTGPSKCDNYYRYYLNIKVF